MLLIFVIFNIIFSTPFLEGLDVFNQAECGKSKSCLRWSKCDFPSCDFAISWKPVDYNSQKYLQIELVGTFLNNTNGYVALGFSRTNRMVDNGVVDCHFGGVVPTISAGYNSVHKHRELADSDIDTNFFVKSKDTLYGVEFDSPTKTLRCRFLRLITPTLKANELKDLAGGVKYYLLSAKGNYENNNLRYHYGNKHPSDNEYNLESSSFVDEIISGSGYVLVKCHACLMIIGWVLLATNGIIIANFYKGSWAGKSFLGEKIWFQAHRIIQSVAVICVSVAFIIIFCYIKGYSGLSSLPDSAHPILGIISTILLLANPIMALFRCHPNDETRWIFNLSHFLVGITAYILALVTMAIGIQLKEAGKNLSNIKAPWILVIIFIVLIIILFIYGEIRNYKIKQSIVSSLRFAKTVNTQIEDNKNTSYEIIIISLILSFGIGIALLALVLAN